MHLSIESGGKHQLVLRVCQVVGGFLQPRSRKRPAIDQVLDFGEFVGRAAHLALRHRLIRDCGVFSKRRETKKD